MRLKALLKKVIPRPLHQVYNRIISKRRIQRLYGDWFEVEWRQKAAQLSDRDWAKAYDRSWEVYSYRDLSPRDLQRIGERVGHCSTLLDAGCGDGYLLERLADRARVRCGVDVSGVVLHKNSGRLGTGVFLARAFLEQLPFPDRAFEVVVAAHTLEHVKSLPEAVAELKRVTARRLIVLVPQQKYLLPYSEDYHLHYFAKEADLLRVIGIPGATCERYTVPPGVGAYSGDVLLLTADI